MSSKKDWKKHFHRMKQIADQNLGRAEKSEVLNEDLVLLEKRVNSIKSICQSTIKKLAACLPFSGGSNVEKVLKRLPESILSNTMSESAAALGLDDTLGKTYSYCGKLQSSLAREIFRYAQQVENLVLNPIQAVLETEIPTIAKLRKQLTKLTLDMDSAKSRYHSMLKQSHGSNSMSSKMEMMKNEVEQAETRVHQCKDQLIIEMYSFLAREGQLSDILLALITSQIDFHRRTLESLENSLPQMKLHTEMSISRPVFGCPLVKHLDHMKSEIAFVIEKCVRSLILHGINEEGLFRVASSSTKVRKLKAGFDANIVNMDDYKDDSHCVAAVLKSYLRELPEPLMTFELYNEWMHIMELPTELRQNALWVVVDKLPKPNYNNLRYIIKFLAKLAANSDVNKMSPTNIAIVIGPNLLWPPDDDGLSVLTATSHSAIIECLINKSEWFFPGELDFGVTEADRERASRNHVSSVGGHTNNLSSISSSTTIPSYISKHRFFGNVFDEPGLNMSPLNNRLSLNSLTSLNDNEAGFERKYSFSSLLEERSSNWNLTSNSLQVRKLSNRVESGTLSLNSSFSYTNRSPLPSSSTSPALLTVSIPSTDVPTAVCSVTKSPTLSVATNSGSWPAPGGHASLANRLNCNTIPRPWSANFSSVSPTGTLSESRVRKTSNPGTKHTLLSMATIARATLQNSSRYQAFQEDRSLAVSDSRSLDACDARFNSIGLDSTEVNNSNIDETRFNSLPENSVLMSRVSNMVSLENRPSDLETSNATRSVAASKDVNSLTEPNDDFENINSVAFSSCSERTDSCDVYDSRTTLTSDDFENVISITCSSCSERTDSFGGYDSRPTVTSDDFENLISITCSSCSERTDSCDVYDSVLVTEQMEDSVDASPTFNRAQSADSNTVETCLSTTSSSCSPRTQEQHLVFDIREQFVVSETCEQFVITNQEQLTASQSVIVYETLTEEKSSPGIDHNSDLCQEQFSSQNQEANNSFGVLNKSCTELQSDEIVSESPLSSGNVLMANGDCVPTPKGLMDRSSGNTGVETRVRSVSGGKERPKTHGNFEHGSSASKKDRRVSVPLSSLPEKTKPQQPVKKSRSLSIASTRAGAPGEASKCVSFITRNRKLVNVPKRRFISLSESEAVTSNEKGVTENSVIFTTAADGDDDDVVQPVACEAVVSKSSSATETGESVVTVNEDGVSSN